MSPSKRIVMPVHWRKPFTTVYKDNYHYGFDYYGDMMGYLEKRRDGRPTTPDVPRLPTLDEHAAIHVAKHRLKKERHGFEPDDTPTTDSLTAVRREREAMEEEVRQGRLARAHGRSLRRSRSASSLAKESELKLRSDSTLRGRRSRADVRSLQIDSSAGVSSKKVSQSIKSVGFRARSSSAERSLNQNYESTVHISTRRNDGVVDLEEFTVHQSPFARSPSPIPRYTGSNDDISMWELKCKQFQVEIEQLNSRLVDAEQRLKSEVSRITKKYQVQVGELESSLDLANKNGIELRNTIKSQAYQISELQSHYDDVQRQLQAAIDQVGSAQKRSNALQIEVEELRAQLENTHLSRKSLERQVEESAMRINELTSVNISISSSKSKLEAEYQAIKSDFSQVSSELRLADDRFNKIQVELKHTVDILRQEQERVVKIESYRKSLEIEVKTLQVKIEEVESSASAGGRKAIAKLETRLREVEQELEEEKFRHSETLKSLRKREAQVKEVLITSEEERTNVTLLTEQVNQLNERIRVYKQQLAEQEGVTQTNLALVRRYQRELESAEQRAQSASVESNVSVVRTKRSYVSVVE